MAQDTHKYHTVRKGETLSDIAREFHTTVEQLYKFNHNLRKDAILEGVKLRVSAGIITISKMVCMPDETYTCPHSGRLLKKVGGFRKVTMKVKTTNDGKIKPFTEMVCMPDTIYASTHSGRLLKKVGGFEKVTMYDYNHYLGLLYGTGRSLISLGNNNIPTRGKLAGATKGTSIASLYFRKILSGKDTPQWLLKILPNYIGTKSVEGWSAPFRSKNLGAVVGRTVPLLGRGVVGINAGMSIYNVYNAHNKKQALTAEAGGWAVAYLGAEEGALIGGAIGVWAFGAGAVSGAVIGGIIGGGFGYVTGAEFGKAVYDKTKKYYGTYP